MDTPEHERRWIEEYLRSQSGEDFAIEHVEKLTSEHVMGREYDVWDAHTNEGRWWVITNPTNLYSQDAIKSMDIALSFHVGLMARVLSRAPRRTSDGAEGWILEVLRRLEVAESSLDRAKEVEDFQAVGMRLRETLVSLGEKLAELGVGDATAVPKRGDFKTWASLAASSLASGSTAAELRGLLKATSEKTWGYVSWLTHARRATELDARLALASTTQVVEAFAMAVRRRRVGAAERCPACGSYRLTLEATDERWMRLCATCGWETRCEEPPPLQDEWDDETTPDPAGECLVLEDFGIYLSPQQAQEMLAAAAERMANDDAGWSSPFAVPTEDHAVMDAHRVAFEARRGPVSTGAELVYECETEACVSPEHAIETRLPQIESWSMGVIEHARVHPKHIELGISTPDGSSCEVFVERVLLDRFGFGDLSSLPERLIVFSPQDDRGWVHLVLGARRIDYGAASIADGWVQPERDLSVDESCPCGSGDPFGSCHGSRLDHCDDS